MGAQALGWFLCLLGTWCYDWGAFSFFLCSSALYRKLEWRALIGHILCIGVDKSCNTILKKRFLKQSCILCLIALWTPSEWWRNLDAQCQIWISIRNPQQLYLQTCYASQNTTVMFRRYGRNAASYASRDLTHNLDSSCEDPLSRASFNPLVYL